MSRPGIGLAMTPTVTSVTGRWRLTRSRWRAAHPSPSRPAAVARAVSGMRVSAAVDKGHDRHLSLIHNYQADLTSSLILAE
jgi:hypothetical protein